MATVVKFVFIFLAIGVPALLIRRFFGAGKRRRRRESTLPFLFFPTTGSTVNPPPIPAWHMRDADVARAELPVQPEPGIADLPPEPEPGIADLPPEPEPGIADLPTRDLKGPALWDRTVPFEPADDAHLRPRD